MKLRTVALLARRPGLRVLMDALIGHPDLDLALVCTHPDLPRAEGGGGRPENQLFEEVCGQAGVPLTYVPVSEGRDLAQRLPTGRIDLLVSLSWRSIVPRAVLDRFQAGAINIHRGALPQYAGVEPVRRAIEAGERRVAITAHCMVEEVDAGQPLAVVWADVPPLPPGMSSAAYAEVIKTRVEPLYAPLARTAIASVLAGGWSGPGSQPALHP